MAIYKFVCVGFYHMQSLFVDTLEKKVNSKGAYKKLPFLHSKNLHNLMESWNGGGSLRFGL